jgi:hypothetical protein
MEASPPARRDAPKSQAHRHRRKKPRCRAARARSTQGGRAAAARLAAAVEPSMTTPCKLCPPPRSNLSLGCLIIALDFVILLVCTSASAIAAGTTGPRRPSPQPRALATYLSYSRGAACSHPDIGHSGAHGESCGHGGQACPLIHWPDRAAAGAHCRADEENRVGRLRSRRGTRVCHRSS